MEKRCGTCRVVKNETEFYAAVNRGDGLSPRCRECEREATQASYRRLREKAINHLGGRCVTCGYCDDIRALVIDHVDGDGAAQRKVVKGGRAMLNAVLADVPGLRFQLLCSNCNVIKMFEQNERGSRVYKRQTPVGREAVDKRRTPERRAEVAEQARRRWAEDPEYAANTRQAQSDAMKRRWASGEVPNKRREPDQT